MLLPSGTPPDAIASNIILPNGARSVATPTGASITAIKPSLRDKLKLQMVDNNHTITVRGIGKPVQSNYTTTTLHIRDNFVIDFCPTYVVDFSPNVDIIIGMNIINLGDFNVDNLNFETSFSFVMPPIPKRINLIDIAERYINTY